MASPSSVPRPRSDPLVRLPDGTVKQVNPLTGTQVWTVPGRADRPLPTSVGMHQRIDPQEWGRHCAFCELRYLETPPEKARLIIADDGWRMVTGLSAEAVTGSRAEFRLVPNLFEIVSVDYWRINHGYRPSAATEERRRAYLATPAGLAHVKQLRKLRGRTATWPVEPSLGVGHEDGGDFFGGFHDVVIARRHFVDGAVCADELASAGTLTTGEHRQFIAFTVAAMSAMIESNPLVKNVATFQNWLSPAGASFDHLHKQIVGLDDLGRRREQELRRLESDPNLFQNAVLAPVDRHDLWVAANEHAVAFVGIGHRYPAVEVWARRWDAAPWELTEAELGGWADLLHAVHTATGSAVPTNEEWHFRPPGVLAPVPLRAVVKWRISTPAGFEGGTRIYINTIDPWTMRDRLRAALAADVERGRLDSGITVSGGSASRVGPE